MPPVIPDPAVALPAAPPRHDWSRDEVLALFALPFPELLHRAGDVHRQHFDAA